MRRTPMSRGSGFKQKVYERTPPSAPTRVRGGVAASAIGMNPVIEKIIPVRDEAYRRLVASMPCILCGIHDHSQAAHANTGKGTGTKADDRRIFPLCADRPGVQGCHPKLDQGALFSKNVRRETEDRWVEETAALAKKMGFHDGLV